MAGSATSVRQLNDVLYLHGTLTQTGAVDDKAVILRACHAFYIVKAVSDMRAEMSYYHAQDCHK